MAIESARRGLREQGGFRNRAAAGMLRVAKGVAREDVSTPAEAEAREMVRFPNAAREALRGSGYLIVGMQRTAMLSVMEAGGPIRNDVIPRFAGTSPLITAFTELSNYTEVAINPTKLVLADTLDKSYEDQTKIIQEQVLQLAQTIPDVKLVRPSAADLAIAAIRFLEQYGYALFGKFVYGTTSTFVESDNGKSVVGVGNFSVSNIGEEPQLDIKLFQSTSDGIQAGVAGLIVPSNLPYKIY